MTRIDSNLLNKIANTAFVEDLFPLASQIADQVRNGTDAEFTREIPGDLADQIVAWDEAPVRFVEDLQPLVRQLATC